jgi:hypothetical protein
VSGAGTSRFRRTARQVLLVQLVTLLLLWWFQQHFTT